MSEKLEFFYDYVSVYSYLADSQLKNLADVEIVYRPMFLGAVMEASGNRPPATVKAKGDYLQADIQRWVERYAMQFRMNPLFPQNTVKALRLALVALEKGGFDTVHRALFQAMWVDEKNLGDIEVIAEIAASAEISIGDIETPAVKELLKENTAEAVARGCFGAPTFFIREQMFFGNDRFDFIAQAIKNPG